MAKTQKKSKKTNWIIIIIVIFIVLFFIGIYFANKKTGFLTALLKGGVPPIGGDDLDDWKEDKTVVSEQQYTNDNFPLKKWSKGNRVKNLQKVINISLKHKNLPTIEEDGYFGDKTEQVLITTFSRKTINKLATYNAMIKFYNDVKAGKISAADTSLI